MGEPALTCVGCGRAVALDARLVPGGDPARAEAPAPWDGLDICPRCVAEIDRRFARPDLGGSGTLAEVLVAYYDAFREALQEASDPDLREVFPGLPRDLLPRRRRWLRQMPAVRAVLERVGRPVCWYDPTLKCRGLGPFWLFTLNPATGEIYPALIDYFDVADLGESANALDYAPDGAPLSALALGPQPA